MVTSLYSDDNHERLASEKRIDTRTVPADANSYQRPSLWKIKICNFKNLRNVEIGLGSISLFIGPNGRGKTAALQALKLWHTVVRKFHSNSSGLTPFDSITLTLDDLAFMNVGDLGDCWSTATFETDDSQVDVRFPIEIGVVVKYVDKVYSVSISLNLLNSAHMECLLSVSNNCHPDLLPAIAACDMHLISSSGSVIAREPLNTAFQPEDVSSDFGSLSLLRNKCYALLTNNSARKDWNELSDFISATCGIQLQNPNVSPDSGILTLRYFEHSNRTLELVSASRTVHHLLNLLSSIALSTNSWVLIDDPEDSIEYSLLRTLYRKAVWFAERCGAELVITSHSPDLAYRTAPSQSVTSFLGTPHRFPRNRLKDIQREVDAYKADRIHRAGWVLFLEGPSDMRMLRAFAERLRHPVSPFLLDAPVVFVRNSVKDACDRFDQLRLKSSTLNGFALFERAPHGVVQNSKLKIYCWTRREIENYLFHEESILHFAENYVWEQDNGLLPADAREFMQRCIIVEMPLDAPRDLSLSWWHDFKVSDHFLCPVFKRFFDYVEPGH